MRLQETYLTPPVITAPLSADRDKKKITHNQTLTENHIMSPNQASSLGQLAANPKAVPMSAQAYIHALDKRFPSAEPFALGEFDLDAFMNGYERGMLSSGEKATCLFIARVWNPVYALGKGWDFDVMQALSCWDDKHRKAFVDWAGAPFWP